MDKGFPADTFLGGVSPETAEHLMAAGTLAAYTDRRPLLRQGDAGTHVLLLLHGMVKIVTCTVEGHEVVLAFRRAGDMIGEMAALERRPRSSTVVACGNVTVRVVQWPAMKKLLGQHPDAGASLLQMLSARLRWANQRQLDHHAYGAVIRLARGLVELARLHEPPQRGELETRREIPVSLTQEEVASLAGLALTTTQKALAELRRDGLVEVSYRKIIITNFPKLLVLSKLIDENP
ncbi:Crp/Fnr family transcriptional regulator [Streptomyces sp. HSW2009]|uniref:Crp/Fnr family transcriptional regulator n=1 Tax=Streptomyces sp. HSW2009 TaxID=3142890 RepID=UPI0032EF62C3